jgi:hypothetical protein
VSVVGLFLKAKVKCPFNSAFEFNYGFVEDVQFSGLGPVAH